MLRRRRGPHGPAWHDRVERATATIVEHGGASGLEDRVAPVEGALATAEADRERLRLAVEAMDPDRVARELKDALRAKATRARSSAEEDALVDALRARYEALQSLQNREEELGARIDATVADLERLAARTLEASVTLSAAGPDLDAEVARLSTHLDALDAAHRELGSL